MAEQQEQSGVTMEKLIQYLNQSIINNNNNLKTMNINSYSGLYEAECYGQIEGRIEAFEEILQFLQENQVIKP